MTKQLKETAVQWEQMAFYRKPIPCSDNTLAARAPRASTPCNLTMKYTVDQETLVQELEQIVRSDDFRHAARLKMLLTLLVEEQITGAGKPLSAATIAREIFGGVQPDSYENITLVHLTANQLRGRLDHYYRHRASASAVRLTLPLDEPSGFSIALQQRLETHRGGESQRPKLVLDSCHSTTDSPDERAFGQSLFSEISEALSRMTDFELLAPPSWVNSSSGHTAVNGPTTPDFILRCDTERRGNLVVRATLSNAEDGQVCWYDTREFSDRDSDPRTMRQNVAHFLVAGLKPFCRPAN